MKFSYKNATQIEFGKGQIARISSLISKDDKILLIYGQGSIKRNGIYDQVVTALKDHTVVEFSGVEANPTLETMNQAVDIIRTEKVDYVLAVGGGSVIDGAKYAVAACHYDLDGWDILTGKHQVQSAIPLGVILTLPATGTESNANAVLTKAATKEKLAFSSDYVRPDFAIMDPDVMLTLPKRQLINGIVDAWVHICEQYLTSPTGAMVQEGYAETLLRNLIVLANNFDNQDDNWRANLMWTANQALNGLIGLGVPQDWATHMIGHELTALYGVDHARSLAIVQPELMRNQMPFKKAKLEQMGRNVFGLAESDELAEKTVQALEAFYHSLDVSTKLTEHDGDKGKAVDDVMRQLELHKATNLGENQAINFDVSRAILEKSVA
jgi:NADP-dependent alcohol dehydrogenase